MGINLHPTHELDGLCMDDQPLAIQNLKYLPDSLDICLNSLFKPIQYEIDIKWMGLGWVMSRYIGQETRVQFP